MTIEFQNELLIVGADIETPITTLAFITVFDAETDELITGETLSYRLQVIVRGIADDPRWQSSAPITLRQDVPLVPLERTFDPSSAGAGDWRRT